MWKKLQARMEFEMIMYAWQSIYRNELTLSLMKTNTNIPFRILCHNYFKNEYFFLNRNVCVTIGADNQTPAIENLKSRVLEFSGQ